MRHITRLLVAVALVVGCLAAFKCEHGSVESVQNQLFYTGPKQRIAKEGKHNFRCFTAQHWEDLYMFQHHLFNFTRGTFVEIGGLDGYSYSGTYFMEKFLDWKGLMVEASPQNYLAFKQKSARMKPRRRRQEPFLLSAACNDPQNLTYVSKSGTGAGILEFMPEDQQKRNRGECQQKDSVSEGDRGCALIPISCINLGDELVRRGIDHIDMFVLDVEGAELEVFSSLRLNDVPVRYFLIELDGKAPSKDAAVRCLLRKHHFRPVGRLDLNEVWESTTFQMSNYKYGPAPSPSSYGGCLMGPMPFATDGPRGGQHANPTEDIKHVDDEDAPHTAKPKAAVDEAVVPPVQGESVTIAVAMLTVILVFSILCRRRRRR